VVVPTGLTSPRAYFNLDWITLLVMAVVAVAGVIVFFVAHRGREIGEHMIDTARQQDAQTDGPRGTEETGETQVPQSSENP
jgi:hypothetical protein